MKNIREVLEDFAYNLQSFSPGQIKEPVKITLPHELYIQFTEQIENEIRYTQNFTISGTVRYNTKSGIKFLITSKEVEEKKLSSKLHNLFKDITNDIY